ncbi:cellulose binding domain-containing protein [Actinorhabdospora filicis]|uniref:cellulose binding domain-containing protein n=1 Tax=Actinorhabdospora filicis TaxID=1785913 RepID=UPI00255242E7|nr:cellulose binding domain-containing protein [Actinorhabdospora filicis]
MVVGVALALVGGVVTGLADAAETDGITATYETTSVWEGGQAGVYTITNTGEEAVDGWALSFSLPGDAGVASLWNGVLRTSGSTHTVTPMGWNSVLGPGAGTRIGFTLAAVREIIPGDCLVDGHECAGWDLLPGRKESGRRPAMVAPALAFAEPRVPITRLGHVRTARHEKPPHEGAPLEAGGHARGSHGMRPGSEGM